MTHMYGSDAWIAEQKARLTSLNATERAELAIWEGAALADNPHGHCDTCGAPCDSEGCTRDRSDVAALEHDDPSAELRQVIAAVEVGPDDPDAMNDDELGDWWAGLAMRLAQLAKAYIDEEN